MSDSPHQNASPGSSDAKEPRKRTWYNWFGLDKLTFRTQIVVAIVAISAGTLFGINAHLARERPSLLGIDLKQLIAEKQETITTQEATNQDLTEQIDLLVGKVSTKTPAVDTPILAQPLIGPGIRVELTDAPLEVATDSVASVNDLVVHQQDIDAVMNALWSGGAEAMTVQGLRVTPLTPIRCIGNVILVDGHTFAPPYVIEAIGDPNELQSALDNDSQIIIYRQYADAYGLGWDASEVRELTVPAVSDSINLQYATPIEEEDVDR